MLKPTLKEVNIITENDGTLLVQPVWADVDRPNTGGYSCGLSSVLAKRLQRAMIDGVVFDDVEVIIDVNGKSFVSAGLNIRMRCANADLNKMGY